MTMRFSRRQAGIGALALFGLAAMAPIARAAPAGTGAGEALSLPAAINKSGRQRMLSQRLGKAYAMLAFNVEPPLAKKIWQQSEALFVSQLSELKKTIPTPEIGDAVMALDSAWQIYGRNLQQTPNKENAQRVYVSGEEVLKRANTLTGLYERQLGTAQARLVNIAGRQRMLSQRMARAFYFNEWGIAADTAKDLETARQEFAQGMKELLSAPQNTPAIKQDLALAEQQWLFFQRAIDSGADGNKHVATTSERILEQMNDLADKYERLSN